MDGWMDAYMYIYYHSNNYIFVFSWIPNTIDYLYSLKTLYYYFTGC